MSIQTTLISVVLAGIITLAFILMVYPLIKRSTPPTSGDKIDSTISHLHNRIALAMCPNTEDYVLRYDNEVGWCCVDITSNLFDKKGDGQCLGECNRLTTCKGVNKTGRQSNIIVIPREVFEATRAEWVSRLQGLCS